MTDAPITNQDLQMTLAQIEDTLAKAVDPALVVDGIRTRLGDLFNEAESRQDTVAQHAIQMTWEHAQTLAQAAQANREAYLTAKDIAGTFQTQRDDVMKELEELTEAVDSGDLKHPKVAAIYEEASDQGYQDGYENAMNDQVYGGDDDYAYDLAWEMMEDKYCEVFGYDDEARARKSTFIDIMSSNFEVQPARKREFFAWLDAVKAENKLEAARQLDEWNNRDDEDGDDDDE